MITCGTYNSVRIVIVSVQNVVLTRCLSDAAVPHLSVISIGAGLDDCTAARRRVPVDAEDDPSPTRRCVRPVCCFAIFEPVDKGEIVMTYQIS